ncbi:MAG: SDR family oxidoreductase [Geminicoccaceae bacterium]|nr:SDR family oxidoreductase [Geminicoccaceae bacterium]MDW8341307.1 SDR family oxidoreductase [Geminicoccaceae bacterium]
MSEKLPYRTALVTGASRGIGAAIVRALCAEGLEVHAVARSAEPLRALAQATGCRPLVLDVTDSDALEASLGALAIDLLVVNAGRVTAVKPVHALTRRELDAMVDVNLRAAMHCARLVLPGMIARGFGHLVFVSSIAAHYPYPEMAVYCACKAALSMFAQNLRLDLLGTGIRVTELNPGRVRTDIYLEALGDPALVEERLYRDFRALEPSDVARVLVDALRLPPHADLARIDLLPTDQAPGGVAVVRRPPETARTPDSGRG